MARSFASRHTPLALHSQDTIRDSTVEISGMDMRSPTFPTQSHETFIFPDISSTPSERELPVPHTAASSVLSFRPAEDVSDLEASTSTLSTQDAGTMTPRARPGTSRSALSVLIARHDEQSRSREGSPVTYSNEPTPVPPRPDAMLPSNLREQPGTSAVSKARSASPGRDEAHFDSSNESVPLLADLEANHRTYHTNGHRFPEAVGKSSARGAVTAATLRIAKSSGPLAKDALKSIPAVILGTLLNILDGISCTSEIMRSTATD